MFAHPPPSVPEMASPDGVFPPGLIVFGKRTRKPNSVYAVIPLGAALPQTLISDLPGGFGHCIEQTCDTGVPPESSLLEPPCRIGPMRRASLALSSRIPPYLVLLRVGFTLPPPSLPERCALTAPFHPYHGPAVQANALRANPQAQSVDCARLAVCFLWHWPSVDLQTHIPDVIRHTALRSSDFPPPEPGHPGPGSDRPVLLPFPVYSNAAFPARSP